MTVIDVNTGKLVFAMNQGRGAFNQIKNVKKAIIQKVKRMLKEGEIEIL